MLANLTFFFQRFSKLFKAENVATIKDAQDAQKAIAQAAWTTWHPWTASETAWKTLGVGWFGVSKLVIQKKQIEKTRPLPHWTASIQALEGIPVVAKVLGKTT